VLQLSDCVYINTGFFKVLWGWVGRKLVKSYKTEHIPGTSKEGSLYLRSYNRLFGT